MKNIVQKSILDVLSNKGNKRNHDLGNAASDDEFCVYVIY